MKFILIGRDSIIYKFLIFLCIIVTLAFHDQTTILLIIEVIFFLYSFLVLILGKRLSVYLICVFLWWFLFILYSLISGIWATNLSTFDSMILSLIQVAALSFFTIFFVNGNSQRLKFLLFSSIIASIILCIRLIIYVPLSAWGTERVGTYIGYGNVSLTYVLSYVSLFSLYYAQNYKKRLYYIFSIAFVIFSLLSGSKKAIIIAFLGYTFLILTHSNFKSRKNYFIKKTSQFILIFIIIIGGTYLIFNNQMLYNSVGVRVENFLNYFLGDTADASTEDRAILIRLSYEAFISHPFLGLGLDCFRFNNYLGLYAHNNYLELLSCLGLVGTVLYYSFFIVCLYIILFKKKNDFKNMRLPLTILFCVLILDTVTVSYSNDYLQTIIAISVSCVFVNKKEGELR